MLKLIKTPAMPDKPKPASGMQSMISSMLGVDVTSLMGQAEAAIPKLVGLLESLETRLVNIEHALSDLPRLILEGHAAAGNKELTAEEFLDGGK